MARFSPQVLPEDPRLVDAVKALAAASSASSDVKVLSASRFRSAFATLDGQTRIRPVTGGRSARVTMPGFAATTYGTALVTGIAV